MRGAGRAIISGLPSPQGHKMKQCLFVTGLILAAITGCGTTMAQQPTALDQSPIESIGKSVRGVPVAQAVKAGGFVFVSGTPGFDPAGKLAVGDFPAQMKQVMENIGNTLKSTGTGWDRVVKVTVMLTRREDFNDMNRVYATYFPAGRFPTRTTIVVSALPSPDFLLEIECQAMAE
jgi:2-iminobutanoate/2-iminopropanoate deaminase